MSRVALLATGGTIASRVVATGGSLASDGGDELLGQVAVPPGINVTSIDVCRLNSFAMTPADMQMVLKAVLTCFSSDEVVGAVVTHGTDTMEETAFLVDLFLSDARPVIFTGAQRSADAVDGDGPSNLRDALTVAAAASARGLGTLIVFDGSIFSARGTRKTQTLARDAFSSPDAGPVGALIGGVPHVWAEPRRPPVLDPQQLRLDNVRVDIVSIYPGCDAAALDAAVHAGARGVVLEASGAGNANLTICQRVRELVDQGVVVLLSTRVHSGPVAALYRGGGGVDLVAAGALPAGLLRPSQARVLLLALLGTAATAADITAAFLSHPSVSAVHYSI